MSVSCFTRFVCCALMAPLVLPLSAAQPTPTTRTQAPDMVVAPPGVGQRNGFEYFSANPEAKVLIGVKVWGEVKQPGIYYVPLGSSLSDTIGAAGGPLPTASTPDFKLMRSGESRSVDLFDDAARMPVQKGDVLMVDTSIKRDLPLIFSGLTVLVSMLTLYFVTSNKKK
jgi:NADH:ubiquinone oxidoreductase subunit F (NADH-binding)